MSRSHTRPANPTSTCTPIPTTSGPLKGGSVDPKATDWMKKMMAKHPGKFTEEEYAQKCCEAYGSVEDAYAALHVLEQTDSDIGPPPDGKPSSQESTHSVSIGGGVYVRIWGGAASQIGYFSFDLVNHKDEEIPKPKGMKITITCGLVPGMEIISIEEHRKRSRRIAADASTPETYLIPEGSFLSFHVPNCEETVVAFPVYRRPNVKYSVVQALW